MNASATATKVPALARMPVDQPEEPRAEPRAERDRDDEERHRDPDDPEDVERGDASRQ